MFMIYPRGIGLKKVVIGGEFFIKMIGEGVKFMGKKTMIRISPVLFLHRSIMLCPCNTNKQYV